MRVQALGVEPAIEASMKALSVGLPGLEKSRVTPG